MRKYHSLLCQIISSKKFCILPSAFLIIGSVFLGHLITACSTLGTSKWGVSSSPRVAGLYDRIPKGGGIYKTGSPYVVGGRWYTPAEQPGYDSIGIASWYGDDFHGRLTANGEIYDMNALTAAHPTLPMPSYVYVTNLDNGRTILVRVNDRGPYVSDRLIDLSKESAKNLGVERKGLVRVRVRYAGSAPLNGDDSRERNFLAQQNRPRTPQFVSAQPTPPSVANSSIENWSLIKYRSGLMSSLR